MCGIAGIINFQNRPVSQSTIKGMTDAMSTRGPDSDGFYTDNGVGFGHRRLSILDLSTSANQPFVDNSGRYIMVFNGEIYNYEEIKEKLPDYAFKTTGDSEVLLAAYIREGAACLRHLRGMFAFVIWDRQEKETFIARDRMGVKPLYYFQGPDSLLFASEIRALLASGHIERKLNVQSLLEYFSYQSISYPESIIQGIKQLEAGSWMKIKDGRTICERYWSVTDTRDDFDFSRPDKVQTQIRSLMLQSVRRRLVSDVPVGAFLSGGIDSSAVVGLMAEASDAKPNTFNIAFEEKEYDESEHAELVAKKFNTNHTKILLKPTVFLEELENALDAMDTPSGDGINTYVVSKAIRHKGITVALSGVGGDELFAGYPFFNQYLDVRKREWLWKLPGVLKSVIPGIILAGQPQAKKLRLQQMLQKPEPSIDNLYPVFRQILSPALISSLTSLNSGDKLITAVEKELHARKADLAKMPLLSQVSAAEYLGYTQHTLLKDTDQMSMAVSLEVREPFFDQDLVEFVLAVPDSLKKPIYPKSLLVESLKPLLPDEIVFRKKQGFTFPWEFWLKNELRSFCDTRIRNMARRSFVNGEALLSFWEKFLAGDPNVRWIEPWLFVVLEYWLEKNNVS